MTWFKIDDSFYDHPKVYDAPDCAVALWTRAGTWSARNLTDGFVPAGMPARLCDDPDTAIGQLLNRGLWKRTRGGYQFHDWSEYQPLADAVKSLREKRAEAGKRGGQAKAAKQTSSKPLAIARPVAKQNATPTRPVPKGRGGTGDLLGDQTVTRARKDPPPDQHEPPPARCDDHIRDLSPPPCGACADARHALEAWEADRRVADQAARSIEAQRRAEVTRLAIDACGLCDNAGRLADNRLCTHDPDQPDRIKAGAAMARAQIGGRPKARDVPPDDPVAQAAERRRKAEAEHQARVAAETPEVS